MEDSNSVSDKVSDYNGEEDAGDADENVENPAAPSDDNSALDADNAVPAEESNVAQEDSAVTAENQIALLDDASNPSTDAETYSAEDWTWVLYTRSGTTYACPREYSGSETTYTLPATVTLEVNGVSTPYPVALYAAGQSAALKPGTITSLSFADNTKVLQGYDLFYGCSSLVSLDAAKLDTSLATNFTGMFNNCNLLTSLDLSGFDTSNVASFNDMFRDCKSLEELDVSGFNTSKATTMTNMFGQCLALTSLDVSKFDTSKCASMNSMFVYCASLKSLDVSRFDTSSCTNMSYMFAYCENLQSLDVSKFDTSKCTNMAYMFSACRVLSALDVSGFNTSNCTNMSGMFSACYTLTTLDVSKFNTSNCTKLSRMFSNCWKISGTLDVSNFDTSKCTDMSYMFNGLYLVTALDVSKFDTSNCTNMEFMFSCMYKVTSLDVTNFDTSKVTNFSQMFRNANALTELDLSSFVTSDSVTAMDYFAWSSRLLSMKFGANFKVVAGATNVFPTPRTTADGGVTDGNWRTDTKAEFTAADLAVYGQTAGNLEGSWYPASTDWDWSYVTETKDGVNYLYPRTYNGSLTFYSMPSMITLNGTAYTVALNSTGGDTQLNPSGITDLRFGVGIKVIAAHALFEAYCHNLITLDVSSLDTSGCIDMAYMFAGCYKVKTLDVSNFDMSAVTGAAFMFNYCYALESLDLSKWDTSSLERMHDMFQGCQTLTTLDLSSFNTSNVTTMQGMFNGCFKLESVNVSSFDTSKVTNMTGMFANCRGLISIDISNFSTASATTTEHMFQMLYQSDYPPALTKITFGSDFKVICDEPAEMFPAPVKTVVVGVTSNGNWGLETTWAAAADQKSATALAELGATETGALAGTWYAQANADPSLTVFVHASDSEGAETPLANADFVLYMGDDWATKTSLGTSTTGVDGKATFSQLVKDGTFWLVESKPSDGYYNANPYIITTDGTGESAAVYSTTYDSATGGYVQGTKIGDILVDSSNVFNIKMQNTAVPAMPMTGVDASPLPLLAFGAFGVAAVLGFMRFRAREASEYRSPKHAR